MTNFEAIRNMTQEQMELFLDQVYLTGLNTGMYAADKKDDGILGNNPFDANWLEDQAEEATAVVFDEEGEAYLLHDLVAAIFKSAGISLEEETELV